MKRLRIDYTIYSPGYVPGQGECWDYPTMRGAKLKARQLGVGSLIVRNFNKGNMPRKPGDWWQSSFCWVWNGVSYKKAYSVFEKKWVVAENVWFQAPLLRRSSLQKPLTGSGFTVILRRLSALLCRLVGTTPLRICACGVGDEGIMAKKLSKNITKARALVEPRPYAIGDAIPLLQKAKYAKFDETVDLTMRLGVDTRHADQMVRGTVVLPHGLGGKSKVVAVIASGDKVKEAEAAGAEFFGGEELVEKIQKEGWTDFDALIATPDMMRSVGRLGKVLGPRGLMPNPKTGTVTTDVAAAIAEIKAGKVEFRADKTALVHVPVGKLSFSAEKLQANAMTVISSVVKAKPSAAKGKYIKRIVLSSTMGPGIELEAAVAEIAAKA